MKTRALGMTIVSVVMLAGVLAFRWADREGRFNLETVYVTGLEGADTTAVARALQHTFGRPLHQISVDSITAQIMLIPGVRDVDVSLIWPGSMHLMLDLEEAAVILDTPSGRIPVSLDCRELPEQWLSENLPVIRFTGEPDPLVLASAVAFTHGFRRELEGSVIMLDSTGVRVLENEVQVILGMDGLEERWLSWGLVRPLTEGGLQVDLRFRGQAVFRRSS